MNKYFRELSVAAALAILLCVLGVFAPHFYELQPLLSRLAAQVPTLVLTLGIGMVMITRQIDISVGSQFGLCAVLAGLISAGGYGLPAAMASAIGAGAFMGALNGYLVAWMRLPSIVVTLATMVTWAEVLRLFQQGKFINLPSGVQWFGLSQFGGQVFLITLGVCLVAFIAHILKTRSGGRHIYAVGCDAEAARLSGIRPNHVTFGVFVLMGCMAGLAAFLNLVQSPQVDPKCGTGLELKAIAAAVVGGIAVNGGRGTLWGAFVGLLLLATINPALTFLHVEAYWEKAIQGLVILLAVIADGVRSRRNTL
jgi:rhamnose transport system permease protein